MATKKKKKVVGDPRTNIIVIGDDGEPYMITKDQWKKLPSEGGQGVINQLKEFGVYLAYIPPDIAVGFGEICTVVNLQSILKNNK